MHSNVSQIINKTTYHEHINELCDEYTYESNTNIQYIEAYVKRSLDVSDLESIISNLRFAIDRCVIFTWTIKFD